MKFGRDDIIRPRSIRLEASTVCQLRCPSCPNTNGEIAKYLGRGFLKFRDFKDVIDRNPQVSHIELSNWGEVFLNKELISMMQYAHRHNVALSAGNGANLNNVPEEILEGMVRYKFRAVTCSIDGASAPTYSTYRINGNLDRVLDNIRRINKYKALYRSHFPALKWQFVAFGHNEHEIGLARRMAVDLNMEFSLKLSWEDLYGHPFSPIKDEDIIRREAGMGVANRQEYRSRYGREYALRGCCCYLWKRPQINFDGRVLGCPVNYWGDYGNAFQEGLQEGVNNDRVRYAREMLMGKKEPKEGIPCVTCTSYNSMREGLSWLTPDEVKEDVVPSRYYVMRENRELSGESRKQLRRIWKRARNKFTGNGRMSSRIVSLNLPLPADEEKGWKPYNIFRGGTRGLSEFSCHVSVLDRDRCPHLPHTHKEEELLLLLRGEVDLIFPNSQPPYGNRRQSLKPGQFVYYPSEFSHTLQTVSEFPASYLMFKWHAKAKRRIDRVGYRIFDMYELMKGSAVKEGFCSHTIFEGSTANLKKLQCHNSTLTPGAGYDPHSDSYDVAIVILEGEVETLGKRVGPHGVIFYAAGEPHGMHNPGNVNARYIVFEFHYKKSAFHFI